MNYRGLLTAVLAAACILAVGTAATGLDSAMDTSADDADLLPEPLKELVMDSPPQEGDEEVDEEREGDPEESDHGDMDFENAMGQAQNTLEASMDNVRDMSSGGGGEGLSQHASNLLKYLLALLALILAALLIYVLDRRYDLRRHLNPLDGEDTVTSNTYFEVDTSNEVYRAWSEMVSELHLEDPHTKTPQEFAEAAVEDGMNPEAVGTVTTLFEQVLYGTGEVTGEQEERALEAMQRLDEPQKEAAEMPPEPETGEPMQTTETPTTQEAA